MRHLFAAADPARALDAFPGADSPRSDGLVQSYRQLADVFHEILSEHSLDNLLERIADTLAELVPYDSLSIYQADEAQTVLFPVLARDQWADEILKSRARSAGASPAGPLSTASRFARTRRISIRA